MVLDPVPGINGMTYPCRDDGIVEFGFDFQLGVSRPDSCIKGLKRSLASIFECRKSLQIS
uniref:Uncharacterized protein n=1 Tax=Candidatus Kentrum sp. UNK TaxID=2126344 RepID=A0A451B171_9GAMM|nr:MAG: hypothetical protein BECKUNK1418G_GA0071005_10938 [Candidatus Kentron sp. UNK]VFK72026.1 MAG: hypothetical protein BECKUNK1418H_GA0071006_10928 [Candidatus Kentron sp. UNK]